MPVAVSRSRASKQIGRPEERRNRRLFVDEVAEKATMRINRPIRSEFDAIEMAVYPTAWMGR